jgi:hypothetical protein
MRTGSPAQVRRSWPQEHIALRVVTADPPFSWVLGPWHAIIRLSHAPCLLRELDASLLILISVEADLRNLHRNRASPPEGRGWLPPSQRHSPRNEQSLSTRREWCGAQIGPLLRGTFASLAGSVGTRSTLTRVRRTTGLGQPNIRQVGCCRSQLRRRLGGTPWVHLAGLPPNPALGGCLGHPTPGAHEYAVILTGRT